MDPHLKYSILFLGPLLQGGSAKTEQVWPRAATMVWCLERRYGVREVKGAGLVSPSEEELKG